MFQISNDRGNSWSEISYQDLAGRPEMMKIALQLIVERPGTACGIDQGARMRFVFVTEDDKSYRQRYLSQKGTILNLYPEPSGRL